MAHSLIDGQFCYRILQQREEFAILRAAQPLSRGYDAAGGWSAARSRSMKATCADSSLSRASSTPNLSLIHI